MQLLYFGLHAASFLSIVDDLQEICTVEHCMDIITWLEDNVAVLASPQIADAPFGVNSVSSTVWWAAICMAACQHTVLSALIAEWFLLGDSRRLISPQADLLVLWVTLQSIAATGKPA